MARSDLLLNLVKAGTTGDSALLRSTIEALAAEERSKQHHVLADRLLENLKQLPLQLVRSSHSKDEIESLVLEVKPQKLLEELFLADSVRTQCNQFLEEQQRRDELRSFNLEPRHKLLLAGPPGNGKTSLAEAIAEALMVPMFIVRYDGLFGSYLGETSQRLRKMLDYVADLNCVLFFDEFESIGKERSDPHELGEIKRVVSSLLVQIDRLPSNVVVIAATNHPETLDRAVWRRFEVQMSLPLPNDAQIHNWVEQFERKLGHQLGDLATLCKQLEDHSFAELELFTLDIHRRYVLSRGSCPLEHIVQHRLEELDSKLRP